VPFLESTTGGYACAAVVNEAGSTRGPAWPRRNVDLRKHAQARGLQAPLPGKHDWRLPWATAQSDPWTRDKVSARELLDDPSRPEAFANSVRGAAKDLTESAKAPKTVDTVGRAKGYGCEDEVEKSMRRS